MYLPARRIAALFVALITLLAMGIGAAGTASAKPAPATNVGSSVPVTGTGTGGVPVTGIVDITKFVNQDGTLTALGTFTGTSGVTGTQPIALPVDLAQSSGSCQILDLVLGPLDLDLLGLQVHLDTVHLNITAQSGPGNLLGNLLCAVAGLLDGPGNPLGGIAALLNRLLGL